MFNIYSKTHGVYTRRQWLKRAGNAPEPGAVLGKNISGGLAPHHLGGNNEQNYRVQLSSIKQLMYRNYPANLGWGWGLPPHLGKVGYVFSLAPITPIVYNNIIG